MLVATFKHQPEVIFDRPLSDGEVEMIWFEIENALGRTDHYDTQWTVLYGKTDDAGNNIVGIRILDIEAERTILNAIDSWLSGPETDGQWA